MDMDKNGWRHTYRGSAPAFSLCESMRREKVGYGERKMKAEGLKN